MGKPIKITIGQSTIEVAPGFDPNTFESVVRILTSQCNESKIIESTDEVTPEIVKIFKASRNDYGTRKIKIELKKSLS